MQAKADSNSDTALPARQHTSGRSPDDGSGRPRRAALFIQAKRTLEERVIGSISVELETL